MARMNLITFKQNLFLITIISVLSSASVFSYPSHNHDGSQHPFSQIFTLPPNPCTWSFCTLYGRCPPTTHWACHFHGKVWCACFPNRPSQTVLLPASPNALLLQVAAENTTTLEIFAEIEAGNNDTLVILFEYQCDEGRQHVECSQENDAGFSCGCVDNADLGDAAKDARLKTFETENDATAHLENGNKHRGNHLVLGSEDGDVGIDDAKPHFPFQKLKKNRCASGHFFRCLKIKGRGVICRCS
jgi:hypothetical protein